MPCNKRLGTNPGVKNIIIAVLILFIDKRDKEGGRERERTREMSICCSTYLCIHWLISVCALTWDQIHKLGGWGQCCNQLSYLARASLVLEKDKG